MGQAFLLVVQYGIVKAAQNPATPATTKITYNP